MKFNFQKRAYKAYLLQWNGANLEAVAAELRELGYTSFEIERGTIMARGKEKSLLCIHQGNWPRFGQNGSFKVVRPDEQATYVPIIEPSLDHVDLARRIISVLGHAVSPSREPGADYMADKIAEMIMAFDQGKSTAEDGGDGWVGLDAVMMA